MAHAPEAPPRAQTRALQSPPAVPALTAHTPLQHPRIEACPLEPPLREGAVCGRPQRVHIAHALLALSGDFHVPAPPVQGPDRWGGADRGRPRRQAHHPAGHKEPRRGRCAFCVALPALVPGTVGLLRVPALGLPRLCTKSGVCTKTGESAQKVGSVLL